MNYQSWPLLAQSPFAQYHRAQQPYILALIVAPQVAALTLQLVFCGIKPAEVPWWIALTMVAASATGMLSTVMLQIPIHRRLNNAGYSEEQVQRLLRSDWIRKAIDIVRMVATVALLRATMR